MRQTDQLPHGERGPRSPARLGARNLLGPVLLGASIAVSACTSKIPLVDPGSPELQGLAPAEMAELRQGRDEYILKCSGCHSLFPPATAGPVYWKTWMEKMAEPARLTPGESRRIERYLLRYCRPDEQAIQTTELRESRPATRRSSLPSVTAIQ